MSSSPCIMRVCSTRTPKVIMGRQAMTTSDNFQPATSPTTMPDACHERARGRSQGGGKVSGGGRRDEQEGEEEEGRRIQARTGDKRDKVAEEES